MTPGKGLVCSNKRNLVNVTSYDDYMNINSYLDFFLLFFDMTTLLQLGVYSLTGGKYGISRGTFFQGHRIVALTTVRATI